MVNANLGPASNLAVRLQRVENRLDNLMTTPWLQNASTGSGVGQPGVSVDTGGVHLFNTSDQDMLDLLTADGSLTAYDTSGQAQVHVGPLNSNPGNYGLEIWTGSAWQQVASASSVAWSAVTGKPSTFPPSAHTHPGTDITSAVSNAANATNAAYATSAGSTPDASGSSHAYNYNVGGTSYYAVWVGNDAGNTLGKNTSSARYKKNIREHRIDPARTLQLKPVLYERRQNGGVTEYGLIAEQVAEHVPELTQWFNGHIDNVRYDLLAVALLEVVKEQDRRLRALEGKTTDGPTGYHDPELHANNAPVNPPQPHPYTIRKA